MSALLKLKLLKMSDFEKAKEYISYLMDVLNSINNVSLFSDMEDKEKVSVINKLSDFPYLKEIL